MQRKTNFFCRSFSRLLFFWLLALSLFLFASCTCQNGRASFSAMETATPQGNLPPCKAPTPSPPSDPVSPAADGIAYDRELAAYITVEDGSIISGYADFQGERYRCGVFQLRSPDLLYWEVVVLRNDALVDVLRIGDDEHGDAFPSCADLVTEADADFDGSTDLLLCLGHFGAQGAAAYKCWLTRGNALAYCPSFTEIANPTLDPNRKEILSQWRNTAASHGYGIYRFLDGSFLMMERLTEEPVLPEPGSSELGSGDPEGELVWSWTDEIFVDGAWQLREYFTQGDYSEETLYSEKVYGDTAYWDISSARWRSNLSAE